MPDGPLFRGQRRPGEGPRRDARREYGLIDQSCRYQRVEDESAKVLRLLEENDGYLPYHDKSSPEDIYAFFGMSKKTFKMTTGNLYKQRKINFTQTGIQLVEE